MPDEPQPSTRVIVVADIASFHTVTSTISSQSHMRAALYTTLQDAFDASGIPWANVYQEDRGDGVFILVRADLGARVVGDVLPHLVDGLSAVNSTQPAHNQIALRVAVHCGEVLHDSTGVVGQAVRDTFRFVDAPEPKRELDETQSVLVATLSERIYRDVTRAVSTAYRRTQITARGSKTRVWMAVFGSQSRRVRLGIVGRTSLEVVRTDKPWALDVDALVISVGRGLGALGQDVARHFGLSPSIVPDLHAVLRDQPVVFSLPEHQKGTLRWLVLAKPHEPETDAYDIPGATRAAIRAAVVAGARRVAVPLLGTGKLRQPESDAADAAVPAVIAVAEQLSDQLDRVVFVGDSATVVPVLRRAWADHEAQEALAGGVSGDFVDPNQGIPISHDQLGVAPYVSMLATVIADRRTPMPLSVGVFGEWGVGKSFFMGLLRAQITGLAQSGNPAYHTDIVQIGFNAWHYADSNLWASLGDEIFRQLAGPDETARQQRERLVAEMDEKRDHRRRLNETTRQAQEAATKLKAEVEAATAGRTKAVRDLLTAMRDSTELRKQLDKLWNKLGIKDQAEQATLLAEQMKGTLGDADALRRSPKDRHGKVALGASVAILAVIGISILVLPTMVAAVGGVAALITGVIGSVWLSRVRNGVNALRTLSEELHANMVKADEARLTKAISAKLDDLRRAEADQQIAEAQLSDVVNQVGELGHQLTELAPGHRLYAFLAERAQGGSYTRDLGLISTIRKDFQILVELMADWRDNPSEDSEGRRPIDRIVLYIDDLDRCGPRQVVEVLQAVHLLLALDLFVVVVGVDPRWLLRALCSHYSEFINVAEQDGPRVLPEDYLEKIINIPLMLPGMPAGSLSRLLRSMLQDEPLPPPVVRATVPQPTTQTAKPEAFTGEQGSEVDNQQDPVLRTVQPRPLTEGELAMLSRLDSLLDTPRAAKRLFNLYRMVRATRDLSGASRFLREDQFGEYQVVVILLGIITADSRLAAVIFEAPPQADTRGGLTHRAKDSAWSEFLTDLQPKAGMNQVAGTLSAADEPRWDRLYNGLSAVSDGLSLTSVDLFQLWIPRIQRFTYIVKPSHTGTESLLS